jgi:orotidine-5'-phosphate decarboxylase
MNRKQLVEAIRLKKSYLCVGLDTDPDKIPKQFHSFPDPVFEFNRQIIDATKDYCVSYKINTAFYEASGMKGWASLEKTVEYIPSTHFKIADAKRGDIGNTSAQYAKAFFETLKFDAVTVAPYMGEDSVRPFLEYDNKWTILLGLTSNSGAQDFELLPTNGGYVYERVMEKASKWGNPENLMFVVGATQAELIKGIRLLTPNHFYLVPGIGAQGGDLAAISTAALIDDIGLLVNVSRSIIYASLNSNFVEAASKAAANYQGMMASFIP